MYNCGTNFLILRLRKQRSHLQNWVQLVLFDTNTQIPGKRDVGGYEPFPKSALSSRFSLNTVQSPCHLSNAQKLSRD